jgi:hypothetical protein
MASANEHRELANESERLADQDGDLADQDRDPAGADRDPAGADRVTLLERHTRSLLRIYPAVYRLGRGEEIIGTLLEATPDGRTWPRVRDVRALVVGGLKARAAQNRQRTVGANLRVAVMAGLAIYAAFWIATYLDGAVQEFLPNWTHSPGWTDSPAVWPAALSALLAGATVVLAWTMPRVAVLAGALAAASVVVIVLANHQGVGPELVQMLGFASLGALAPRAGHPSRHWLWLPGVIALASPLVQLGTSYGWLGYSWQRFAVELPLLAVAVGGILWIGIDARLMLAVLTYFALTVAQMAVVEIPSGPAILAMLPFLLVIAALTVASGWLLRRQSAHPVR